LAALDGLPYRSLSFNVSDITDDDFACVKPVKSLVQFEAQMTGLGDKALEHLAGFENLEEIDLRGTRVTDAGIPHLARLERLQVLILTNTAISDAAVEQLRSMTQLRYLFLNGTAITPEGAARLRRALPNCTVDDTSTSGSAYPPEDWRK
jgi:hypothetical protein